MGSLVCLKEFTLCDEIHCCTGSTLGLYSCEMCGMKF